ncbi:efflux bcr cfla: drug resistance transporter bcr/cfla subfamily [Lucifera butyrica]|uniref:Bcr/CflA family efflux transporter n=1 Tax=Lucifera butyrica TaxID=1351585 RepID=A0A498RKJ8_9FIRM|nr:multidrug effflux MFS transporter [Lucifera butyrica]VBB09578.1 efflux bcr cfla: drug resistance transporter bcr/cfla subfamily [Lucifera butyrica]
MNSINQGVTAPAIMARNRLWIAAILGCLAGMGPLCTDLYLPALPQIAINLNASASLVQFSLTATLLGIAIGQIFIGPNSDINGRKRPLVISLLVFIIVSFLCSLASSIWELIIFRFVQGLAGSGGIVLSRAIACDLYSGPELTKFFSLLMLINGIAPIFSPVIGGQILALSNWQGIFSLLGLFSIILTLAVILGMKESLPEERRTAGSLNATFTMFHQLFDDKSFVGYTLVQGFIIAGLFAYIAGSPFVLQTIYGLSAATFSFCFAVNGFGIMLFAQLTGYFTGKFTEKQILVFGLTLAFLCSMLLLAMSLIKAPIFFILIPLFIIVSCIGITTTASFSLAIRRQPHLAGSASGLLGVVSFIFGALASPLVGLGNGTTAIPMAIVITIANLSAHISYFKLAKTE